MGKETWVFLRGLGREARHWGEFLPVFSERFPDARLVSPDLPGAGSHFTDSSPTSVERIVGLLRSEVSNSMVPESNFIVGMSLGAMVVVDWISRYPNDFKGAVLINPSFAGLNSWIQRVTLVGLYRLMRIAAARTVRQKEREILKMTSNRTEFASREIALREQWALERPITIINNFRQLVAAAKYRLPKEVPTTPILLLGSDADTMVDPECSRALARKWPVAYRRHETAGHDLTLDAPDWVRDQILAWKKNLTKT